MTKTLLEWIEVSQKLGANPAFVQGGGGNTSIKLQQKMAIKASGSELKSMNENKGYVFVSHQPIVDLLDQSHLPNDEEFTQRVRGFHLEGEGRPSIETAFHACLGSCVLHSHSVYANVFTCSREGQDRLTELFGKKALWIPYANPGQDLSRLIREKSQNRPGAQILFLQNHGLITWASSPKEAWALHEEVNLRLKEISVEFNRSPEGFDLEAIRTQVLFPDQVVYTTDPQLTQSEAGQQTLQSHQFILKAQQALGLTPQFLSPEVASAIESMESEKYRQRMVQACNS